MADTALTGKTSPVHHGTAAAAPRRVLVVSPAWLGDTVMAHSLFKTLHRDVGAEIDVLAPAWARPLLHRMPEVGEVIDSPFRSGRLQLKARFDLARALSRRAYRQAIVLPNSWKSALAPFLAGIPLRTGYVGEQRWGLLNDARRLDKAALPMTAQRFVALATAGGTPVDIDTVRPELTPAPRDQCEAAARALGAPLPGPPILALCPGAEFGPAKRWPAAHYAALARSRSEQGWQVWLLGSAGDKPVAADIQRLSGGMCLDLTGRTGIGEVLDLLSLADVVVSNDSGLMHTAAALGRPLVAVFGSTDPAHTPPLTPRCRILTLALDCSPCFARECPLHHLNCLQGLPPSRVSDAIDDLR